MDRNYDKPYCGLPTEIRLQIWKLMIPDKAIIATKNLKKKQKKYWPNTQIQLLRLNHQIHDEALPIFRKLEVYLHPECNSRGSWRDIVSALQSPTLNKLAVSWEQVYAGETQLSQWSWISTFFFNFLSMDMPHSLHRITISFGNPFFCHIYHPDLLADYLRDPEVVAILAAAYLQLGLVTEVYVKIHQISSKMMPRWSAEYLSRCLAGTAPRLGPGVELRTIDYLAFRRQIIEKIDSNLDSGVRITAEFPKDIEGKYEPAGLVTFTLVVD